METTCAALGAEAASLKEENAFLRSLIRDKNSGFAALASGFGQSRSHLPLHAVEEPLRRDSTDGVVMLAVLGVFSFTGSWVAGSEAFEPRGAKRAPQARAHGRSLLSVDGISAARAPAAMPGAWLLLLVTGLVLALLTGRRQARRRKAL